MKFYITNHWTSIWRWMKNKFRHVNYPQFYLFGVSLGYDTADIDEEIIIKICLFNFSFEFWFNGKKFFDIIDPDYIKNNEGKLIKIKRGK